MRRTLHLLMCSLSVQLARPWQQRTLQHTHRSLPERHERLLRLLSILVQHQILPVRPDQLLQLQYSNWISLILLAQPERPWQHILLHIPGPLPERLEQPWQSQHIMGEHQI